ncbi:MAG: oxidoreductase [Steroidobacteraceae bacterium]
MSPSAASHRSDVWLVTGVSSGIGQALAQEVLKRGLRVIGTLRKPQQIRDFEALAPGRAFGVELDVTDAERVARVLTAAIEAMGGHIGVAVNNAGRGLPGAVEELPLQSMRELMEVNFFGAVNVIKAVLPFMRRQRAGHLINVSSLAGVLGVQGMPVYSATKFALEGLSEGLRREVREFGIRLTIVELGLFRTNFRRNWFQGVGSLDAAAAASSDDYPHIAKVRDDMLAADGQQAGDPVKAAHAIMRVVDAPRAPLRLVLGRDALEAVNIKLSSWRRELDEWAEVSCSTDFDEPQGNAGMTRHDSVTG